MSTFKEKNIKFNKHNSNEKKSEHYNIIDAKHTEIMEGFDMKSNNLDEYKNEFNNIIIELEKLDDECEINKTIDELQIKISKTNDKLQELRDGALSDMDVVENLETTKEKKKKVKKKKSVLIQRVSDNKTDRELLLEKTEKILETNTKKLLNYQNIYLRNCYINDLKARKDILEEDIYNIENNIDELNYLDDTYDILHEYFEKDEQVVHNNTIDNICDLFTNTQQNTQYSKKRKDCVDKYLQTINARKRYKRSVIGKSCTNCGTQKILNTQEGIYSCDNCGESEIIIIDSEKPSYKDPVPDTKSNTYKRSNHCSELLNQSQGKESTDIELQLYEDIKQQLHIIGITDLTKITKDDIKQVLKNIDKSAKSEHAVYIINKLNGIPVSTMSHKLNEMVKKMFSMVEEAWYIFKDPERKNFMNTNYVFHKIFELLDEDEEAEKWPYLSDIKLSKHDDLWEKICNYWNWEFIPSI